MDIKFKLNIEGVDIEISQDKAKELYLLLEKFFGEKNINIPYPVIIERWDKWYPDPIWVTTPKIYTSNGTQYIECNTSNTSRGK